jgi:hypothetical protein
LSPGTTSWTAPAGVTSANYLVVGGGGGGGTGGGGGANYLTVSGNGLAPAQYWAIQEADNYGGKGGHSLLLVVAVAEPGCVALLGIGMAALGLAGWKRKRISDCRF